MWRFARIAIISLAALLALVILVDLVICIDSSPYIYQSAADAPYAEAIVIPGAGILDGTELSPIFKDRADTAIALFAAGKASKILVSGDNGSASHDEVDPAHAYLIAHGIPAADIFLDHAGFDTYSTMYRAKAVFGVTSAIIASQAFHLPRAIFIARSLGIDAYGVDAGSAAFGNYIREAFADDKAIFDLLIHRQPEYLGAPIPISGDGSQYP